MSRGISQSDQPIERSGDGTDLFSKFDDIIALREGLLASGQEDPFSLVMEKVLSPTRAICNGRETILPKGVQPGAPGKRPDATRFTYADVECRRPVRGR